MKLVYTFRAGNAVALLTKPRDFLFNVKNNPSNAVDLLNILFVQYFPKIVHRLQFTFVCLSDVKTPSTIIQNPTQFF